MNHFPLFLDVRGRPVLVVGAGLVAERKIALLCAAGAQVVVVALQVRPQVQVRAQAGEITLYQGEFEPGQLDSAWLVFAATGDPVTNRAVADAAQARRLWCNVVDDAELSSAQVPAIVDRSPVVVAISSGGAAPVVARHLRERIEAQVEPAVGSLAALLAHRRSAIRAARPELRARRALYRWALEGPVLAALRCDLPQRAEALLSDALARRTMPIQGRVLLVGAGPGAPGLLTLRGLRALNEADVILHDRLVSTEVLALARRDALRISVGKVPGEDHEATQRRIHALLLQHARRGRCVVRLKGGDPLVYGRGGEELEFLRGQGVAYEVVPGITAALACAAYAGIPLTHRDHASTVTLATAHRRSDLGGFVGEGETRVYYMGVERLPMLCAELVRQGLPAATPCALVENGSRPGQRTLHARLGDLAVAARRYAVCSPALLIVGEVADLGTQLAWFGETLDADSSVAFAPSAPQAIAA
ncbi:MAG TPA: siroheme synthase CysG [Castellaniella sp.]|uniref:siroheme synthase CysG n=1 Tax=Castellaniella sp. TaxID=1955812 RepID=UPI002EF150D1